MLFSICFSCCPFFLFSVSFFFFFNDTATTEIYTLSLHDALPISGCGRCGLVPDPVPAPPRVRRSEEHTSELQSRVDLVCRLLLEKKKTQRTHLLHQNRSVVLQLRPHVAVGS